MKGVGSERWLLPAGIEEILPPLASELEAMRRTALDLFEAWGYDLVMPPLLEYLESLLVGAGAELELQTLKVIDQDTGRLMGIRADMTPQVARIDARYLAPNRDVPVRLCYVGSVLHAQSESLFGSRSPMQIGAELYGFEGVEGDVEVMALLLALLERLELAAPTLDLGHSGLYRALVAPLELGDDAERELFEALQRKSESEVESVLEQSLAARVRTRHASAVEALVRLPYLNGGHAVMAEARSVLRAAPNEVSTALDELDRLLERIGERMPNVPVHIDLAEARGYRYYGGPVFAVFVPGYGREVARGGRYDQGAVVYGEKRPACGFSSDLRVMLALTNARTDHGERGGRGIFAPYSTTPGRLEAIERLRGDGYRVIEGFPGQPMSGRDVGCVNELSCESGEWDVVPARDGDG